MSYSPETERDIGSPDIFIPNVRCNLDSQFQNARESIKSENMCVYARVRPMLAHEKAKGYKECLAAIDEQTVRVIVPVTSSKHKSSRQSDEIIEDYTFSAAFGPESGQFVFFQETMLNTMQNFIEGSNSLVFSYGITGSGKTYTLQGNSDNPGIIPLSMKLYFGTIEKQLMKEIVVKPHHYCDIVALSEKDRQQEQMLKNQLLSLYDEEYDSAPGSFRNYNSKSFAMSLCEFFYDSYEPEERLTTLSSEDMAASQAACQLKELSRKCADKQPGVCSVWVSFIEIYNETIFDLLQPFSNKRAKLSLGEDKNGNVYIKGAREICISSSEEALKILNIGRKQLSIASTKMNYQSSRSHCIYTLRVVRVPDPQNISYGKVNRLSFCDLAGSERASKTQTTGARLKEAGAINTSLLVLGRCLEQLRMNQMGKEKRIIPFRESKLTRLFSGFFLGQGKAAIIANASPSDYSFDETLHVLKFSAHAKKIMVNDTFLSNASSTLQNITNQWHNYKANTSAINESMESLESDSDIIQMKDDLIEKLLELADNQGNELAKEKKEKAELEMKIRQQVCREYSEYSDQIIESHRLNHEAERNSLIEIYKKRIANMERMYENVIKGYKEQLRDYETDESLNESSADVNESLNELHNSDRKSLTKSPDFESSMNSAEVSKTTCTQNTDIETLKLRLSTISSELHKANALLLESQNTSSNLEIELSVSKAENENLSRKIAEYQIAETKYTSVIAELECQAKDLDEKLSAARNDISVAKEQIQLKSFNICELETELEVSKSEIERLRKCDDELKCFKTSSEADIQSCKQTISTLEQKLLVSQKDLEAQNKLVKLYTNEVCDLKKELEASKNEIERQKKCDDELKCFKTSSEADIQSCKRTISTLEQKLLVSQKDLEAQKEMVKLYTSEVCDLKKEVDDCREDYEKLKRFSQETSRKSEKLDLDIQKYKEALCCHQEEKASLKSKLVLMQENEAKLQSLSNLEEEIESYKLEIEKMNKEKIKLESDNMKLKSEITKYESAVSELELDLSSANSEISVLKSKVQEKTGSLAELQNELKQYQKKLQLKKDSDSGNTSESNSSTESYKLKVKKLEDELSTVCQQLEASKIHLGLKSLEASDFEFQIKEDKRKLEALKKEKEKYEVEKIHMMKKLKNYDAMKKELEEKLSSVIIKMDEEKKELLKKIEELEKDVKTYKASTEKLENYQETLQAEKLDLTTEIHTYETTRKVLEGRLASKDKELKEAMQRALQIEPLLKEIESKSRDYEDKIEKLQKDRETVEAEKRELISEIVSHKAQKADLKDKLAFTSNELKTAQKDAQKISPILSDIENTVDAYKQEITKLKENQEISENEKEDLRTIVLKNEEKIEGLNKQLSLVDLELKSLKDELLQKNANLQELKDKMKSIVTEINELRKSLKEADAEKSKLNIQISSNKERVKDLEEKLSIAKRELHTIKEEMEKKNSRLQELENENHIYKCEVENYSSVSKLADVDMNFKNEAETYRENISNLEVNLEALKEELKFNQEKLQIQSLSCKELETEISQLKEELDHKKLELKDALDTLKELEEDFDKNHNKLKEFSALQDQKKILEEKHTLLTEELASLTLEHQSLKEKLSLDDEVTLMQKKHIDTLEEDSKSMHVLLNILQNIEMKATHRTSNLISKTKSDQTRISDLNRQIGDKERNIEDIEKALLKLQIQLQSVQESCDKKLISEKEQHEIEVREVIKLKQLVEDENLILIKEISDLKEKSEVNNQPKKEHPRKEISNLKQASEASSQPKKDMPKADKMLPMRHGSKVKPVEQPKITRKAESESRISNEPSKQPKITRKAESESRISNEPSKTGDEVEVPKRSRKRVSYDDFEVPSTVRSSKRMKSAEDSKNAKSTDNKKSLKSAEDSKIPVTRTSRRRLHVEPEENLSPVQKVANRIGQKFKNLSESVSKLSTPRMTRGKRKLYNPEISSPSIKKVTRSKKP